MELFHVGMTDGEVPAGAPWWFLVLVLVLRYAVEVVMRPVPKTRAHVPLTGKWGALRALRNWWRLSVFQRIRLTRRKRLGSWRRPSRWMSRDVKIYDVAVGRLVYHVCSRRWWGCSVFAVSENGQVVWSYDGTGTYHGAFTMKRRTKAEGSPAVQHLAAMESVLFSKMHPLVAHCCCTQYDDGSARKPGWWTVKTMGSAWVVEVKDPDTCSRLVVVQQSVDDALALASILLESDEAPWEPDPWLKAAESKAKKK